MAIGVAGMRNVTAVPECVSYTKNASDTFRCYTPVLITQILSTQALPTAVHILMSLNNITLTLLTN